MPEKFPSLTGIAKSLLNIAESIRSLSSLFSVSTPIAFRAQMSSNQSLVTGVIVPFDAVDFDKNSNYDNSTYKFTAPVDGVYLFCASLSVSSATDQGRYGVLFYKNDSLILLPTRVNASGTGEVEISSSFLINLTAGDTVHVVTNFTDTKTINGGTVGHTSFSGAKIDAIKGDTGETGATGPAGSDGTSDYLIKTGNYTMVNDDEIIDVDTTGVAITITLPPAPGNKQIHIIKNTGISSNNVTVDRNSKTIDKGTTNLTLRDNDSIKLQYTTDGWKKR